MPRYDTISAIVDQTLNDLGESQHRFQQFLSWALWGAREWHFDGAQEIKTVCLKMNPSKAIELPEDCVDWTKVGIQVGDKVKVLGTASDIALIHPVNKANIPANINDVYPTGTDINAYGSFSFYNFGGRGLTGYGTGIEHKGWFRQNERQLQFDTAINHCHVYLEYISNGWNPCGETVVNEYAADAIRQYIHWQRLKFSRAAGMGEKQEAERMYWEAHSRAKARVNTITVADFLNSSRKGRRLTPHA